MIETCRFRLSPLRALLAALAVAVLLVAVGEPAKADPSRVALVIGIGKYQNVAALPNPPHDAQAVAASLRNLGFDVEEKIDSTYTDLKEAIRLFGQRAQKADAAVVFYAGHGIQVDHENYLIPADADLPADDRDRADYQTMFARRDGSVAAPTAGLHFTDGLVGRLKQRGITIHFVTLHVGPGTFLPVKADDTADHRMQPEWGVVSAETAQGLKAARRGGGRIGAVGSTAMRLVESAAGGDGAVRAYSGDTALFVTPGYTFRAVDALMTNFHLPRSTLFMLVAAFSGLDTMKRAYAHAIRDGYRFYSYGDACLLFRARD